MIKLGILMDPISLINIKKDSSFAMLLEAQRRNYTIYYMEMNCIYLRNGEARVYTQLLKVEQNYQKWFEFTSAQDIAISDLDVVLIRKDPPFNIEFIYATYILERAEDKGVLMINTPQSLRDYNEKISITSFDHLIPDTLVSRNASQIRNFREQHGDIILKPLDSMGGNSIFYIKREDPNLSVIIEILTSNGNCYCMAQNYLAAIKEGDKRVLVVDGKPVPYCLARIPKAGETRGNLAAGARGEIRLLSEIDHKIANHVGSFLKKKGLLFIGIDIIGNHLTEINITSPTGICEIESKFSFSITGMLMDAIEKRLS